MRLIEARTRELKQFDEDNIPPYGILSHTWGRDTEEVTLSDMRTPYNTSVSTKPGYRKIDFICRQATLEGLDYAWSDTCCIDKTSSAELSEAINSMWRWYQQSAVCWVYLQDMPVGCSAEELQDPFSEASLAFLRARWFTRGWTLQELLAAPRILFFSGSESLEPFLGDLSDVIKHLQIATKIERAVLEHKVQLRELSIAKRMSWASDRSTTRVEDRAYSLLGIFDINMPMLYGEGEKAFQRLQEEILRATVDLSIFAWTGFPSTYDHAQLLASSPANFANAHSIVKISRWRSKTYRMTNNGLEISLPIISPVGFDETKGLAILDCGYQNSFGSVLALSVQVNKPENVDVPGDQRPWECTVWRYWKGLRLHECDPENDDDLHISQSLVISRNGLDNPNELSFRFDLDLHDQRPITHASSTTAIPFTQTQLFGSPKHWDSRTSVMTFDRDQSGLVSLALKCSSGAVVLLTMAVGGWYSSEIRLYTWSGDPGLEAVSVQAMKTQLLIRHQNFTSTVGPRELTLGKPSLEFSRSFFLDRAQSQLISIQAAPESSGDSSRLKDPLDHFELWARVKALNIRLRVQCTFAPLWNGPFAYAETSLLEYEAPNLFSTETRRAEPNRLELDTAIRVLNARNNAASFDLLEYDGPLYSDCDDRQQLGGRALANALREKIPACSSEPDEIEDPCMPPSAAELDFARRLRASMPATIELTNGKEGNELDRQVAIDLRGKMLCSELPLCPSCSEIQGARALSLTQAPPMSDPVDTEKHDVPDESLQNVSAVPSETSRAVTSADLVFDTNQSSSELDEDMAINVQWHTLMSSFRVHPSLSEFRIARALRSSMRTAVRSDSADAEDDNELDRELAYDLREKMLSSECSQLSVRDRHASVAHFKETTRDKLSGWIVSAPITVNELSHGVCNELLTGRPRARTL